MATFTVDVTAVISLIIEADNESHAQDIGYRYIECGLEPDSDEVSAWNEAEAENGATGSIVSASDWTITAFEPGD